MNRVSTDFAFGPLARLRPIALFMSLTLIAVALVGPCPRTLAARAYVHAYQTAPDDQTSWLFQFQIETRFGEPLTAEQMETVRTIVQDRASRIGIGVWVEIQGAQALTVRMSGIKDIKQAVHAIQSTTWLEFVSTGDNPLQVGQVVCTTHAGCPRPEARADSLLEIETPQAEATQPLTVSEQTDVQSQPTATRSPTVWSTILDGIEIDPGKVSVTYAQQGQPQVWITLRGDPPTDHFNPPDVNARHRIAILVDNRVIASSIMRLDNTPGTLVIEGLTIDQANALIEQIRVAEPLPYDLRLVSASWTSTQSQFPSRFSTPWLAIGLALGTMLAT